MRNVFTLIMTLFLSNILFAQDSFEKTHKGIMINAINVLGKSIDKKIKCLSEEDLSWKPAQGSKTIEEEVIQIMDMTLSLRARISGEKAPEWDKTDYLSKIDNEYLDYLLGMKDLDSVQLSNLPPDGGQPVQGTLLFFLTSRLFKLNGMLEVHLAIKGRPCE